MSTGGVITSDTQMTQDATPSLAPVLSIIISASQLENTAMSLNNLSKPHHLEGGQNQNSSLLHVIVIWF